MARIRGRTYRDLLNKDGYRKQLQLELKRINRRQKQDRLKADEETLKLENMGQSRLFTG